MAQSPTSNSATLNNAAKDDSLGSDGDFTFTIADLLANDPGGAARVDVGTQFFFGTAEDQDNQAEYMAAHGILDNGDGTFTLTEGAIDFQYMVQIGNRGTWSQADVDVTAPEEPCSDENIVTNGTFEGVTIPDGQEGWANTVIAGWTNTGDANDGGIEAWNQAGLTARSNGLVADGDFVIETDGWGNGALDPVTGDPVIDNIGTEVNAIEGQEYELSFNFAARNDGPGGDTDGFDVYWNGELVDHFDPTSASVWSTANLTLVGDANAAPDTLEIRETGANDAYGALIDNVQLVAQCGCNHDLIF